MSVDLSDTVIAMMMATIYYGMINDGDDVASGGGFQFVVIIVVAIDVVVVVVIAIGVDNADISIVVGDVNNVNGTDDVDDLSVAFGIVVIDIVRIVAVVVVVVVCASANVGIFILLEFLMLVSQVRETIDKMKAR
uniref:Uncharacterized protein n=1 Tax=Glossina pallidipes TaxID=7398 RepID=A0A1A9ZAR7_GLOPL